MAVTIDTDNALVTLADAKEWARVKSDDTTFDQIVTRLVNSVSAKFNEYTRRKLLARDLTEYYDAESSTELFLNNYPINSVTSLHLDVDREYGAETEETDYIFYAEEGRLVLTDDYFPRGPKAVKIVYNAGYSSSALPDDLELACLDQIKFLFNRWQKNEEAIDSVSMEAGNINIKKVDDLLPSVKSVLDKYVRPNCG